MDSLRYSPDDPYYRIGPVTRAKPRALAAPSMSETNDWNLPLGLLKWARAEPGDLTDGYSGENSRGLSG